MIEVKTVEQLQPLIQEAKKDGKTIGFVPTMGFLHDGHRSLIAKSKHEADSTVVSIFVNPLQFNDPKDYQKYPIDLERDRAMLRGEGVDVAFIPSKDDLYPENFQTHVEPSASLSQCLEGAHRPGHFKGVTTVVTILFNAVQPNVSFFGEKDFQQLRVIEQMVLDLKMQVRIARGALIREEDGLALSSRNVRLSKAGRTNALVLSQSLFKIQLLTREGESDCERLKVQAGKLYTEVPEMTLHYLEIVDEVSLKAVVTLEKGKQYRALVAGTIDGVRLIDNVPLTLP